MATNENFLSSYNGVLGLHLIEDMSEENLIAEREQWQSQRNIDYRSQRSVNEIDFILYSIDEVTANRQSMIADFIISLDMLDTTDVTGLTLDSAQETS